MMQYHQHYNNITAHAAALGRCQLRAGEIIENSAWCARWSLGSDKWAPILLITTQPRLALLSLVLAAARSNKLLFYSVSVHTVLCRAY